MSNIKEKDDQIESEQFEETDELKELIVKMGNKLLKVLKQIRDK